MPNKTPGGAWGSKALGYFLYHREEWLASYHKRSNVETAFSMIKRKFGDFVRSKTDVAMANEALCKVLAHNLVVLIHEMYELGIEPAFWGMWRYDLISLVVVGSPRHPPAPPSKAHDLKNACAAHD